MMIRLKYGNKKYFFHTLRQTAIGVHFIGQNSTTARLLEREKRILENVVDGNYFEVTLF